MNKISHIMVVSFIVNLVLSYTKFISGIIFSSSALVADGIHSFSDLLTDVVSIIGSLFINKKNAYKVEYITSLFVGVIVFILGVSLLFKMDGHSISTNSEVIFVSIFAVITKIVLARYLILSAKKYNNSILKANGIESSADVISSILVLISGICVKLSEKYQVLRYADRTASILVGLFIVITGLILIKNNLLEIVFKKEKNI